MNNNIFTNIEDYINCSRFIKHEPLCRDYYDRIYKNVFPDEAKDKLPELFVCCSSNRDVEQVKFLNKDYLIYDEALGSLFSIMNNMYFDITNPNESLYYIFRLLAEQFYLCGKTKESQLSFIESVIYESKIEHKYDEFYDEYPLLRLIQELFVFHHEARHWELNSLIGKDEKDYRINKTRDLILQHIDNMATRIKDDDFINSIIDKYWKFLENSKSSYENYDDFRYYDRYIDKSKIIDEERNLIVKDDHIVEECYCDFIASLSVIDIVNKSFNIPRLEVIKTIYLCMEHLATLKILLSGIQNGLNDAKGLSKILSEVMIRTTYYKNFVPLTFDNREEVTIELIRMNERHLNLIQEKATLAVYSIVKNSGIISKEDFFTSQNDYCNLIRLI